MVDETSQQLHELYVYACLYNYIYKYWTAYMQVCIYLHIYIYVHAAEKIECFLMVIDLSCQESLTNCKKVN